MRLITTTEASKILGVNQSRVRQMILEGKLPARKHGRDWVIRERDLQLVKDKGKGRDGQDET